MSNDGSKLTTSESEPASKLDYASPRSQQSPIPWQRLIEALGVSLFLQAALLYASAATSYPARDFKRALAACTIYWLAAAILIAFRLRRLSRLERALLAIGMFPATALVGKLAPVLGW